MKVRKVRMGSVDLSRRSYVTKIRIISQDYDETGTGIVLQTRPLMILVPAHVSVAIEDGSATTVFVEDAEYRRFELVTTSSLEQEHLSIVRFQSRAPEVLRSVTIPRRPSPLAKGMPVACLRKLDDTMTSVDSGSISEVVSKGLNRSFLADIPISPGDSGSPMLSGTKLIGVCVGISEGTNGTHSIAIPFSRVVLKELRRIALRTRQNLLCCFAALLLIAAGALAIRSWTTFTIAGVDGPVNSGQTDIESPNTVTASNGQLLTLRPSWKRTFPTSIRWWVPLAINAADNRIDRVAIGTLAEEDLAGSLFLLGSLGQTLWSYTVPDGECVFNTQTQSFNRYKVYRIYIGDLTGDGRNEILASFTHEFFYPTKIVLFDLSGEILGEYWHPGYVRTFAIGQVGESEAPMLIMTGSNNRFRPEGSPWNPQGLMAFSSEALKGQAPPYTGKAEQGNELWYYLLPNVDDEHKSHFDNIIIADSDADGKKEILAHTSDDRFYYLNEHGEVLRVELGDEYLKEFGSTEPPELQRVELNPALYEDWTL